MPVLHVIAGPNGAGKTTFFEHVLGPATGLPFVNADAIARQRWPGDEEAHGHAAAKVAASRRAALLSEGRSFVTETVFSHASKLELLRTAKARGYLVHVHVVVVPLELTLRRVKLRKSQGGHSVPARKVRERFRRLWALLADAIQISDETVVYDNTSAARPFREVARYLSGTPVQEDLPAWSPLPAAGRPRTR